MFFYPLWTLIWAIYHALNFILMPYYRTELAPYPEPWPFYLSNWTYTVLTIGAVWDCVATIYVYLKKQSLLVPVPGKTKALNNTFQPCQIKYNVTQTYSREVSIYSVFHIVILKLTVTIRFTLTLLELPGS